jgi:hypothetical protein
MIEEILATGRWHLVSGIWPLAKGSWPDTSNQALIFVKILPVARSKQPEASAK